MRTLLVLLVLMPLQGAAQNELSPPATLPVGARFGAAITGSATCGGSNVEAVAVGAPHGTAEAPGPGAVVRYNGVPFQATNWTYMSTVPSPTGLDGDLFGASLDAEFCEFGGWLVGAPGAEQAFHYPGALSPTGQRIRLDGSSLGPGSAFGTAVDGTGANLVVGAPGAASGAGRALVFSEYSPGTGPAVLAPRQTLAPSDAADRGFGTVLTSGGGAGVLPGGINARRLIVGAPDGAIGAVYIYALVGSPENAVWAEVARLTGPPGFGRAIHGASSLAVASPDTDEVYVFAEHPAGTWALTRVYDAPAGRRVGENGVAILHAGGGTFRVVATAPPDAPLVFYGSQIGSMPTFTSDPSPRYGSTLAAWTVNTYRVAVGDPEADGVGAAWTGNHTVFPISAETSPGEGSLAVRAMPQPAVGPVSLHVTAQEMVTLEVFDALGRRVWQGITLGTTTLPIDTSRWSPGLYTVRAASGAATATTRLVIAR